VFDGVLQQVVRDRPDPVVGRDRRPVGEIPPDRQPERLLDAIGRLRGDGREVDRVEVGLAGQCRRDGAASLDAGRRLVDRLGIAREPVAAVGALLRDEFGLRADHVQVVAEVMAEEFVDERQRVVRPPGPLGFGPGPGIVVAGDEPRQAARSGRDQERERGPGEGASLDRANEERRADHAQREDGPGHRPDTHPPPLRRAGVGPVEPVAGVDESERRNPVEDGREERTDRAGQRE